MIYLDTSVILAHLFAEDRRPPASLWTEPLVSSRLLEYEIWNRAHARGLTTSHAGAIRRALSAIGFVELAPIVLARALEPFPVSVRTLDGLHLASAHFVYQRQPGLRVASYDERLLAAARASGLPVLNLE